MEDCGKRMVKKTTTEQIECKEGITHRPGRITGFEPSKLGHEIHASPRPRSHHKAKLDISIHGSYYTLTHTYVHTSSDLIVLFDSVRIHSSPTFGHIRTRWLKKRLPSIGHKGDT